MIKITVKLGNLIEEKADAIVNPTNCYGIMDGSVSKIIKNVGGEVIEVESMRKSPIPIGKAILTDAGMLPFRHIIHSPTLEMPTLSAKEENIRKAVFASLKTADSNKISRIAMPGMGTGIGGFEPIEAARIMIEEIKKFKETSLKEIILIDINESVVMAFKSILKERN